MNVCVCACVCMCEHGNVCGCECEGVREGVCECWVGAAGAGIKDGICLELQSLPLLESFWLCLSCRCRSVSSPRLSDL